MKLLKKSNASKKGFIMRNITKEATEAFWNGTKFSKDNTSVHVDDSGNVYLSLYGNIIAYREKDVLTISSRGRQTNTTKERLNGILGRYSYGVYQKKHKWYLADYTQSNKHDIEFYDGMEIKL